MNQIDNTINQTHTLSNIINLDLQPEIEMPENLNDKEFTDPTNIHMALFRNVADYNNNNNNIPNIQRDMSGCSLSNNTVISPTQSQSKIMLKHATRLREKVIVYEYMCYQTSNFYTRLNKVLLFPSIGLSSLIALLNSNLGNTNISMDTLQLINVIGNSLLTFVITLKSTLKHAEKADYFFNLKKNLQNYTIH